jgi:hypothetical protein
VVLDPQPDANNKIAIKNHSAVLTIFIIKSPV